MLPTTPPALPSATGTVPPLTVVKLKPRRELPPKLDTEVEISEPPEALIKEFTQGSSVQEDQADLTMADAQFDRGLSLMKTGNSEGGVAQMQQFIADWPRHPKADNALYFSGLALLAQKDFERATEHFDRVIRQYPAGDAVLDSMLKLAECRFKLNQPLEARSTWEKIINTYPGTSAATQAQARLHSSFQAPVGSP